MAQESVVFEPLKKENIRLQEKSMLQTDSNSIGHAFFMAHFGTTNMKLVIIKGAIVVAAGLDVIDRYLFVA